MPSRPERPSEEAPLGSQERTEHIIANVVRRFFIVALAIGFRIGQRRSGIGREDRLVNEELTPRSLGRFGLSGNQWL